MVYEKMACFFYLFFVASLLKLMGLVSDSFIVIGFQTGTVINGCLSIWFGCLSDSECSVLWFRTVWFVLL